MSKMLRLALVAFACLALTGAASAQSDAPPNGTLANMPQWFAEMTDASQLPRMAGAQELFASKATTSLVVQEKVPQAAAATRALLVADGWQQDGGPSANDTHAIMNFRKGAQALNVFIGVAPAQGGATMIQYTPAAPESVQPAQPPRAAQAPAAVQAPTSTPAPQVAATPARPVSDPGLVDVTTLPRPAGAYMKDEQARKAEAHSIEYMVPATNAATRAALIRLLGESGWVAYATPLERDDERHLHMKKGIQGLSVFLMTDGTNTSRSGVWLTSNRLSVAVPFPPGASDIMYDPRRPLMDAIAPGTVESVLAFFRTELAALGWHEWSAEDAARYPNAKLEEKIDDGVRAYFAGSPRDGRDPIQVSLGRRNDGRVDLEVRVPPFARPQELKVASETFGLPVPERANGSRGRDGQTQREIGATVAAERDVVLAFYRRELARLSWKEEPRGPITDGDDVVLNFTTTDGKPAVLKLGFEYDLTTVSLVQQLPDKVARARAKARQDAEEAARKRAEALLNPPKVLAALATANAPMPVPETAEKVRYDAARGEVRFETTSRPREVTAFYRAVLPALGFKELTTVIDSDRLASLHFTRAGKHLDLSISGLLELTNVTGYGDALAALAAEPRTQHARDASAPARIEDEQLERDESIISLPVPKQVTMSFGTGTPFGLEREATVKASLEATLGFYRRELAKLGWKEEQKGAVIKPTEAKLAFTTPDGTGLLILGREDGKTTVKLTKHTPAAAAQEGVVARPGMGLILLGSALDADAVITINGQTITLAPGAGKQGPGPKLELKPGTYKASVKISGKAAYDKDITIAGGQTIGLLVGPGGMMPLPLN